MGRKKKFTNEAAIKDALIDWVAKGKTVREFCRQDGMPAWRTIYEWIEEDKEFAARIAQARQLGFDAIAEEALEISNTPIIGEETEDDGDKVKVKRGDMLGHRKLQVETRLKLLAKWDPKRYGDRQQIEHSGKVSLESLVAGSDD